MRAAVLLGSRLGMLTHKHEKAHPRPLECFVAPPTLYCVFVSPLHCVFVVFPLHGGDSRYVSSSTFVFSSMRFSIYFSMF
jgi:hypothetical protein